MKIADHIYELICLQIFIAPMIYIMHKHDWSIDWLMSTF